MVNDQARSEAWLYMLNGHQTVVAAIRDILVQQQTLPLMASSSSTFDLGISRSRPSGDVSLARCPAISTLHPHFLLPCPTVSTNQASDQRQVFPMCDRQDRCAVLLPMELHCPDLLSTKRGSASFVVDCGMPDCEASAGLGSSREAMATACLEKDGFPSRTRLFQAETS